jgi:integrase
MSGYVYRNKQTGTWYGRVDLTRRADGRRKQIRVHAATEAEVKKKIRQVLNDQDDGLQTPSTRRGYTVNDAIDTLLYHRRNRAFRTRLSYEADARLHLRPKIGALPVTRVTPGLIEDLIEDWKDEGLGATSIRCYLTLLSMVLKRARSDRYIMRNPMEEVQRPERARPPKPALKPQEAAAVLLALSGTALMTPYLLQLSQGGRPGELLAILRGDVDRDIGRVRISGALEYRGHHLRRKTTKTPAGERYLYPPNDVMERVVEALDHQVARLAKLGLTPTEMTPLFDRGDGALWHPDSFRRAYTRHLRKAGVPHAQWRGARHTFATILRGKVDRDVVKAILGHTSYATTEEFYVKPGLEPDEARRAGEVLWAEIKRYGPGQLTPASPE